MRTMPDLESERLLIRPFTPQDSSATYHILASIGWVDSSKTKAQQQAIIADYIEWCSLNHRHLAQLYQPPYGDRAVVLKKTNAIIGTCGLVPCLDAFGVFPAFGGQSGGFATAEVGLLWTIGASHQQKGYATEVAKTLINYALTDLNLKHIIATTEYDNIASQKVMENAGMRLERNPFAEPPWLQIMGIAQQD